MGAAAIKSIANIVQIEEGEPKVGTWELSLGFETDHRALTRLVEKYKSEFEESGFVTTRLQQIGPKKKGRQVEGYSLNEEQAIYLTTLLTNNDTVRKFKRLLSRQFVRQRKLLYKLAAQKGNAEWLAKREAGIIERRKETDTIKNFVDYAIKQGSQNANKYYMIITKMQNNALFSLEFIEQKFPNIREIVNGFGLDVLKMSDHIVERAIDEGMAKALPYKEIYVMAKDRVTAFANAIGKTPLQQVVGINLCSLEDHQNLQIEEK